MSALPMYIAFALAALLIVLGFVALLKQKTYLDSKTAQPTEIEIPLLGKMKANYPALVFVFLGVALVFYDVQHYSPRAVLWHIGGTLKSDTPIANWQDTRIQVFPWDVATIVDPATGRFEFSLAIPEGESFESVVQKVYFDSSRGSGNLSTALAFDAYRRHDGAAALIAATDTTREYVVPWTLYPEATRADAGASP